jgi:hypothetical protein
MLLILTFCLLLGFIFVIKHFYFFKFPHFFLRNTLQNKTQKTKKKMARKSLSAASGNMTIIVILALSIVVVGVYMTLREGWSSPSLSGGRVSGSGPGQAPKTFKVHPTQRGKCYCHIQTTNILHTLQHLQAISNFM